jgi:hypothetical protein
LAHVITDVRQSDPQQVLQFARGGRALA